MFSFCFRSTTLKGCFPTVGKCLKRSERWSFPVRINGGQLVGGGCCHFKSSPGASAAAVIIETVQKGVFCALWMQKRASFSLRFNCFLGQALTIFREKTSPRGFSKNKILNPLSQNACICMYPQKEKTGTFYVEHRKKTIIINMMNEILSARILFYAGKQIWCGKLTSQTCWSWPFPECFGACAGRSPRRPAGWSDSSPAVHSRPAEWRWEVGRCVSAWV